MQNNPSESYRQEQAWNELWRILLEPESLRLVEPPDERDKGGEAGE